MSDKYMIGDEILVSPTSPKMYGKYKIIGVDQTDIKVGLVVKQVNDLPSKIGVRVGAIPNHAARLLVKEHTNLTTSIFTKQAGRIDFKNRLTIRPKRSMFGLYEVIEPPDLFTKIYPLQDTFIRSDRPRVNYGKEESIIYGNYFGTQYQTLIQYNINAFRTQGEILGAKIVLNTTNALENFTASVYKVTEQWSETNTTWLNSPGRGELVTQFQTGGVGRFEIDITEQYLKWYEGEENFGIYIIKDAATELGTREHSSKESISSHYIEVRYKDPFVYSFNNLHNRWSFRVQPYMDIKGQLEVNLTSAENDYLTSMYVHDPTNMPTSIDVNTPNLDSKIDVKYAGYDTWQTKLTVTQLEDDDFLSEITVKAFGEDDLRSRMTVVINNDMPTNVEVLPSSYLNSQICSRVGQTNDTNTLLTVKEFHDLKQSLTATELTALKAKLAVRQEGLPESIPGKFKVLQYDEVTSELTVQENKVLTTTLKVRRDGEDSTLTVIDVHETEGLISNILPRVIAQEDPPSYLFVNPIDLPGKITAIRSQDMETPSELAVRVGKFEDIDGRLVARAQDASELDGNLRVRVARTFDTPTHFIIRSWDVDDLFLVFRVEGGITTLNYAFIM